MKDMKLNLSYPAIKNIIDEFSDEMRSESASFLIWYLINYYRMERMEAIDSVCDQSRDRGIDGIVVDSETKTIIYFQSKITTKDGRTVGDSGLREFAGSMGQLSNGKSVDKFLKISKSRLIGQLVERLSLKELIEQGYTSKGVFVSNMEIDSNGLTYLDANDDIEFIGGEQLIKTYISSERDGLAVKDHEFDCSHGIATYEVNELVKSYITLVSAVDLVRMDGIANQQAFIHNVRGSLGRTQVNKDINETVRDKDKHPFFPLFHNGITVICQKINVGKKRGGKQRVKISGYNVVNGCQSLTTLYQNSSVIEANLYVMVKLIQVDVDSELSQQITQFSNNQNGIKARDFKANDAIQIRLQNEFKREFKGKYWYEVKRGEMSPRDSIVISNEEAGSWLLSFDLKDPWSTVRRYALFDDKHSLVYGRQGVSADRIVLCYVISKIIESKLHEFDNSLFARYKLTSYVVMYILRLFIEVDNDVGAQIISKPGKFIKKEPELAKFKNIIGSLLSDIIIDVNLEVKELGDDFDYRGKLRDVAWVNALANSIVSTYKKNIQRKKTQTLTLEWNE